MIDVSVQQIERAAQLLEDVALQTPLQYNRRLSKKYQAEIYLKREDLQEVRSFKIRGAYNKMSSLTADERQRTVVCASAGNHAQGVAYCCAMLQIEGVIYMPVTTPTQKINKVEGFGDGYAEIRLVGDTFDAANEAAHTYCESQRAIFVHPFDDALVIAGQGTVGKEIYDALDGKVDIVCSCVGGGGLISGISTYLKGKDPEIRILGAEPEGAASMKAARQQGRVVSLKEIDPFVDGAAVATVGHLTFQIAQQLVDQVYSVPEGKICTEMVDLYQNEGLVIEPAGVLSIAILDEFAHFIQGKTVVCLVSGGNNDILRYPEIMERSLLYQGRKHYFLIEFAQKPGQLKTLVTEVLGPNDDIVRFEYIKKTNAEKGPAFVGIELTTRDDLAPLLARFANSGLSYQKIESDDLLYGYLV
ncbi:MAG: threonine ammonia-lyase IlvA [Chloroflexota bacterium]